MGEPVPPDTLFHYTDPQGAFGIATSATLRATSVGHLNDAAEFIHAYKVLKAAIRNAARDLPKDRRPYIKTLIRNLDAASSSAVGHFPVPYGMVYVASFCTDGDLLSQWRAYGRKGGCSLGFRLDALAGIAGEQGFDLVRCIYGEHEQLQVANTLADSAVREIAAFPPLSKAEAAQMEGRLDIWPPHSDLLNRTLDAIRRIAPTWKHHAFREEQEWRLVSRPDGNHEVKFRPGAAAIVPYIEIKLDTPSTNVEGKITVLRETFVGPFQPGQPALSSLHHLFQASRFGDFNHGTSRAPVRTA